jgi:cupin 2 domain-containing protein
MPSPSSLFADIPARSTEEIFSILLESGNLRVERIVSHGHASPEGFWYDQEDHEWVVVLRGAARLRFEDEAQPIEMKPGDYVNIPAHRRHRVEWTTPAEATIWLAIHHGD